MDMKVAGQALLQRERLVNSMKFKASSIISISLTLLAAAGLLMFPAEAAEGARVGLSLCAAALIPSLFPFTVLASMLMQFQFPYRLGKVLRPVMEKVFRVSGPGSAVFILGLAGGYPLGASVSAELYSDGQIEKQEAERLLGFCNNCGPAFVISVAGNAVFGSVKAGFFLYGVHIAAAILTGIVLKGHSVIQNREIAAPKAADFSLAFSSGVKRAVEGSLMVCGFVVFFSVLIAILDAVGTLPALCGRLSAELGLELHFTRSFIGGILELGTGVGSMLGLSLNAQNTALAAFILGWGGLSVHAQSLAVIRESGLSPVKHFLGKALHGGLSALLAFFAFSLIF